MWEKPLPNIDLDSKPLFEAYDRHDFALYRCTDCGEWYFPKSLCRNHENEAYFGNIALETASGEGEVFATARTHRLFHPGFEDDLPYTYAMIELAEGPLFGSRVVESGSNGVPIGTPVEVSFEDVTREEIPEGSRGDFPLDGGFSLPYFVPATGSGSA